jgi:hypothetical protein
MAVETMLACVLNTLIDSRHMRICTYNVRAVPVSVDDMALLASQSMGGPVITVCQSSRGGGYRGVTATGWYPELWTTWNLVVAACCAEEAHDALYWVEDHMKESDDYLPCILGSWRLRGGCLEKDTLTGMPEPSW